jgi:hypothetical protein
MLLNSWNSELMSIICSGSIIGVHHLETRPFGDFWFFFAWYESYSSPSWACDERPTWTSRNQLQRNPSQQQLIQVMFGIPKLDSNPGDHPGWKVNIPKNKIKSLSLLEIVQLCNLNFWPSQIYDKPSCVSFLWVHFKSSQIRIYQIIKPTWEWFYYVYLIIPILDPQTDYPTV